MLQAIVHCGCGMPRCGGIYFESLATSYTTADWEAIGSRLEVIASRLEAMASRFEALAHEL